MIVTITNHKGGVGKTTTAVNLAAGLANGGNSVLLIDLDPQANATQSLGLQNIEHSSFDLIKGESPVPVEVYHNLEIIPAEISLVGAEMQLINEMSREKVLRKALQPYVQEYDIIIIDSSPSIGLLNVNAFTASDALIIPVQGEYLAAQGFRILMEVIEKVRENTNPSLELMGVLLTQYDDRKVLNKTIGEAIKKNFGDKVFNTRIRSNVSLAEAPAQKVDIFRYAPSSNGAKDYGALTEEILKIIS